MPNSTSSICLVLRLPTRDFSVYVEAAAHLRKIMGRKAPDVVQLMEHTLRCRDARGLVEDYLESIDWPVAPRKSSVPNARMLRRTVLRNPNGKRSALLTHPLGDPARN